MQLPEQLGRVFWSLRRAIDAGARDQPREARLGRLEYLVLAQVEAAEGSHEPLRPRDLACSEQVDASTMSRRLAGLTDRGLLEQRPDPADGRARLLDLTAGGRQVLAAERTRRIALVNAALADWPEEDRAELSRLLARLEDSLAPLTQDRGESRPAASSRAAS